ncbi:hypothetical protein RBSH_05691 [Rhodopirellula baltica SH28]|uniref:Uncharacterized protein n=1 Tax=Rhodopirellula baltica SH28 TaxID=993517 RepID=K5D957_RHOBT|nr:hypothetical protein RBSH_05691 [Rhodopirellula baltica SH28]
MSSTVSCRGEIVEQPGAIASEVDEGDGLALETGLTEPLRQ